MYINQSHKGLSGRLETRADFVGDQDGHCFAPIRHHKLPLILLLSQLCSDGRRLSAAQYANVCRRICTPASAVIPARHNGTYVAYKITIKQTWRAVVGGTLRNVRSQTSSFRRPSDRRRWRAGCRRTVWQISAKGSLTFDLHLVLIIIHVCFFNH